MFVKTDENEAWLRVLERPEDGLRYIITGDVSCDRDISPDPTQSDRDKHAFGVFRAPFNRPAGAVPAGAAGGAADLALRGRARHPGAEGAPDEPVVRELSHRAGDEQPRAVGGEQAAGAEGEPVQADLHRPRRRTTRTRSTGGRRRRRRGPTCWTSWPRRLRDAKDPTKTDRDRAAVPARGGGAAQFPEELEGGRGLRSGGVPRRRRDHGGDRELPAAERGALPKPVVRAREAKDGYRTERYGSDDGGRILPPM